MTTDHDDPGDRAPASDGRPVDRPSHLGYLAHEIRNPLSTALWTAELLARLSPEDRGGARGVKLSGICLRSVSRVRLLVEDHLLCERLDAGGYGLRPEPVAVAELLGLLQGRWPADAGPLTLPPDRDLVVLADRALLERALDGLLAVATGAEASPVSVEAKRHGKNVLMWVSGVSVGPLEDPERGAPSDQRGRVLSLAMARRVAVALGGRLTVEGQAYLLSIPAA